MPQETLLVNGEPREVRIEEDMSLLDVLREQLQIISPKNGCSPQGYCGCCTVLVDGKPRVSCTYRADRAVGRSVVTIEGMDAAEKEKLARAFVAAGGLQCGFCTPGIFVRTKALLDATPDPDEAAIRKAMDPHLCRCTGYAGIFASVREAACIWQGGEPGTADSTGKVGTDLHRYLGVQLALGEKPYIDDLFLPGMLHAAVVMSEHPRARVLSIETAEAEQMPGVAAVVTAEDVPGERYQGLVYKDWPCFVAVGEETRCVGDILAAVAAETPREAREAAARIRVRYEVLEPLTAPRQALEPEAPKIHPKGNLLGRSVVRRGNVDEELARAAHVVRQNFRTQRIEHAYLEPEASVAVPEDDGLRVYTQGQGVHDDQRQLASLLGLPAERLRVTLVSNGGAFGGKEDLSIQGHAGLLALRTGRPVKLVLSREESILLHPKRHPFEMEYTVGCDEEGRLLAVRARLVGDTGAYASVGTKVLERGAGHACGAYRVESVEVEALTVYTNNPPCGAMRGFGVNQTAFAMESCLDMLAERVGIDGWEMRYRNVLRPGDRFGTGQVMTESAAGLLRTLEAVQGAYRSARYAGIACGIKNVGIGNGMADIGRTTLEVEEGGRVSLYTGFTEMGQGLFTVLTQFACDETGLPPSVFQVHADSHKAGLCGMTTASRATVLGGEATRRAAQRLKKDLDQVASLEDLAGNRYVGEYVCDFTTSPAEGGPDPVTHLSFGYATQVAILDDDGRLAKVVAAHDVGKAVNPVLCRGQIEGSLHMGLGYALSEDLPCEGGWPVSTRLKDLGILRATHIPEMEVHLVEVPDPLGPHGAKGVGEIGLVPTAPAVAGALYAFDGVRRVELPMRLSPATPKLFQKPPKKSARIDSPRSDTRA